VTHFGFGVHLLDKGKTFHHCTAIWVEEKDEGFIYWKEIFPKWKADLLGNYRLCIILSVGLQILTISDKTEACYEPL
jgi:hypothetical protein